jgi:hypothetical protein
VYVSGSLRPCLAYSFSQSIQALDHVNYADTFAPPPYYAQCVDTLALHHNSYYQDVKPAMGFDGEDGAEGINVCHKPTSIHLTGCLITVNTPQICEAPALARRPRATAPPPLILDCSDLNDIYVILATPTDESDCVASVVSTTSSVTETEDEVEYIEPEDVIRHYWIRGDIKYTFVYCISITCHNTYTYSVTITGSVAAVDDIT